MELSLHERKSIIDVLESHSVIRQVLDRFCQQQVTKYNDRCAENMRAVPRHYEEAADYAAKAEAYREFLSSLIREIEQSTQV